MVSEDLALENFTAIDRVDDLGAYVGALLAFDAIEQLQELKRIARALIEPGSSVLDVGCGFGLETLRLAQMVGSGPPVRGLDLSAHFVEAARRRATAAGMAIEYAVGNAEALPYAEAVFDHVRAERLLIYLGDVRRALVEMKRVLKKGGRVALIEPNFGTTTVNVPNRSLVRRVMAHEVDTAVAQSSLPGSLLAILPELGFDAIELHTRIVVFPQGLGGDYFSSVGLNAHKAGAISDQEAAEWHAGVAGLVEKGELFGTIDYFLFTAVA